MNKEYGVWDKETAFVITDNETIIRRNSDNLEKILVKENLLEKIMSEITELTLKKDKLEKDVKESIFTAIICPIIAMSMVTAFNLTFFEAINSPLKIMNYIEIGFYLFGITASAFAIYCNSKRARKKCKGKQGVINEINYLTKTYEHEKSELAILENEKDNKENEYEIRKIKKINDMEELENLKNNLILYYNCGYKQEKYFKWYENGKLKQKLEKIYDEAEIDKIEKILEETKEQSYVKKKGQKRK